MTKKRLFSLLACMALVISLASCAREKDGNVEYLLDTETDTYTLSYYTDTAAATELVIPDEFDGKKITAIGELSINNADSLQVMKIGKNITSIDKWAITNCRQLREIQVAPENEVYCSVDGVLFNKDKTELLTYPNAKGAEYAKDGKLLQMGSYVVPDGVITISHASFYKCYALESVTLPGSVVTIEDRAFQKANNLANVTVAEGLQSIGIDAFHGCEALTEFTLPATLKIIAEYAFFNAFNLKKLTIKAPQAQLTLGESWFPSTAGRDIKAEITMDGIPYDRKA